MVTYQHTSELDNNDNESVGIILPTATLYLKNNNGTQQTLRVLKDSASQSTFILNSVLNEYNHKIVSDNVDITINGLNSSATYKTKIVELQIQVPNQGSLSIKAIGVPNIKTKMQVPHLKEIATTLQIKNYNLADKQLIMDELGGISLIIGADNSLVLPITQRHFGNKSNKIFYFNTPSGIMLTGDSTQIFEAIKNLPQNKTKKQKQ